jgi:hypothetical protein
MRRFLKEHSLSIVLFTLFFASLAAQTATGFRDYNNEQKEHGEKPIGFVSYLGSGHFGEALFENWESEFLQMSSYVLLTVWLRQKGSAESKKVEGTEDVDRDPRQSRNKKGAPWPVRKGGLVLKLYENSLSLAFIILFLMSLLLHGVEGTRSYNEEQKSHNSPQVSVGGYMTGSRFWFESFQNWQSEFMATGAIVVLSVYLRQRGSPESKPVDMPHSEIPSAG